MPGPSNPALEATAPSSTFCGAQRPRAAAAPADPQLPPPLSEGEAARLRNRSSILARHVFAGQGEGFADAQVLAAGLLLIKATDEPTNHALHRPSMPRWHSAIALPLSIEGRTEGLRQPGLERAKDAVCAARPQGAPTCKPRAAAALGLGFRA